MPPSQGEILDWPFINSLAPWASAFATSLAAGVALWVATRKPKIDLRARVVVRPYYLQLVVTNHGTTLQYVSRCALQFLNAAGRALQPGDRVWINGSSERSLPAALAPGEILWFNVNQTEIAQLLDIHLGPDANPAVAASVTNGGSFICETTTGLQVKADISSDVAAEIQRIVDRRRLPPPD